MGKTIFLVLIPIMAIMLLFSACGNNTIDSPPADGIWSQAEVFTNPQEKIEVSPGDTFIIGYGIEKDMFPVITEEYDASLLELMDKRTDDTEEQNVSLIVYEWFLFRAKETGETQITIEYRTHIVLELQDTKIFQVSIE